MKVVNVRHVRELEERGAHVVNVDMTLSAFHQYRHRLSDERPGRVAQTRVIASRRASAPSEPWLC
jgi:hypothetical protein